MFMRKNRRAQVTAEYAVLIAIAVGAVVAMQTYAKRSIQGKIKDSLNIDVGSYSVGGSSFSFSGNQFEPSEDNDVYQYSRQQAKGDSVQSLTNTGNFTKGATSQVNIFENQQY